METLTRTRLSVFISSLLSDKSLTKKAYLNALASMLEYATTSIVGFFLTPFMVTGLGDYSFGLWQILNQLAGYLNSATGRPSDALKWTLANQQVSKNYERKRRFVGSTLVIWCMFLPILLILGGVVAWFVPYWIHASVEYMRVIRVVTIILVVNIVLGALVTIPQAVLQGENMGYKRMGLSAGLILLGGGLRWLAIYLNTGIVGVSLSVLVETFLIGIFFLIVVRQFASWFGVSAPLIEDIREMLARSWWFVGWSLVMMLSLASSVVILGIFDSVNSVTNYSLNKYAPEMMIPVIANIVFAIVPGLGGIIGSGDLRRAVRLRGEMMSIIWLVVTTLGAGILLCNRSFIGLWVGAGRFTGFFSQFLIVISAIQFVFIRSEGHIIDVTLHISRKVILGFVSVTISIVAASLLVGYFKLGIVGLCLGIITGRLILTIGYPVLISRFLETSLLKQLRGTVRPLMVTIFLFSSAIAIDKNLAVSNWPIVKSWLGFFAFAGLNGLILLAFSFYCGLNTTQRFDILRRVRMVYSQSDRNSRESN